VTWDVRNPGGTNEIGRCRRCDREKVELLRVQGYGRMCSQCLLDLCDDPTTGNNYPVWDEE